jgi:hypothetical protein
MRPPFEGHATWSPARSASLEKQINMCAGEFPPAESDGQTYLKIPLNQL